MDQGDFNRIKRYLMVIARGIFVVVIVFILGLLAGRYVVRHLLPTMYQATALIEIQPRTGRDLPPDDAATVDAAQLQAELQVVESPRGVLLPVVDDLGLDRIWGKRLFKSDQAALSKQDAVTHLAKMLKVDLRPGTNTVEITASSISPKEAADIANDVAERYKNLRDQAERERMARAKDAVKMEMVQTQQQALAEKQAALEKTTEEMAARGIQISPQPSGPESIELQSYRAAKRDLDSQKALLDALNAQLHQPDQEGPISQSPVRILTQAEPALEEANDKRRLHRVVILVVATFLAVSIASSVEVLFLLSRASQRPENY